MKDFDFNLRRVLLVVLFVLPALGCKIGVNVVEPSGKEAVGAGEAVSPLRGVSAPTISGKAQNLEDYLGKVALVVNTASNCGFTGQYEGLEALYAKYGGQGFVVLGFPCNDFGGQEPGNETEIQAFCSEKFQVTFPMFTKIHVVGEEKHPLYGKLTEQGPADLRGEIKWNFTKFLLDRQGRPVARFAPFVEPDSDSVVQAIERALAANPGKAQN